jgi:bromodomain-containing protein 7/9
VSKKPYDINLCLFALFRDQAPDYREVIECPMDFSTIREKIEDNAYENIGQFRSDVELITGNAQIYNGPGNLFYIAAQKLTNLIKYYFSEKYLTYLLYALPFGKTVPVEQLGLKMPGQTREKSRQALHKEREREKIRALVK